MGPLHQWHLPDFSDGGKLWEILQSEIIFQPKICPEPHTISICRDDEFSTDQSTKTLHLQRGIQHFRRCASRQGVHHMGRPQGLETSGGPGLRRVSVPAGPRPSLQLREWEAPRPRDTPGFSVWLGVGPRPAFPPHRPDPLPPETRPAQELQRCKPFVT